MKTSLDLIDRLNSVRDAILVSEMAIHADVFATKEKGALASHLLKIIEDLDTLSEDFSDALGIKPDAGIAPDGAAAEADESAVQA